jgi:hypothetical protein
VLDRHCLDVPAAMPAGTYQIEVGLYDASSGDRIAVDGSPENRIVLEEIDVTAP